MNSDNTASSSGVSPGVSSGSTTGSTQLADTINETFAAAAEAFRAFAAAVAEAFPGHVSFTDDDDESDAPEPILLGKAMRQPARLRPHERRKFNAPSMAQYRQSRRSVTYLRRR